MKLAASDLFKEKKAAYPSSVAKPYLHTHLCKSYACTVLTRKYTCPPPPPPPPVCNRTPASKLGGGLIDKYHRDSKYLYSTFPVQGGGGGGRIFSSEYSIHNNLST